MPRCFVGLGANMGDPLQQLRDAAAGLRRHSALEHVAVSSVYRSPPMGPRDQPDYLNAVARLDTNLAAESLLNILQELERQAGRVRDRRWGPRTLDLDLLLYGNERIDDPRLTVPHPGLAQRAFVLVPLRDLSGEDFVLPGGQSVAEALSRCQDSHLLQVAQPADLLATYPECHHREQ